MNENISFRRLKAVVKSKGITLNELAAECGKKNGEMSDFCNARRTPKTDLLAKMCSVLKVYPSEIVSFDGVTVREDVFADDNREPLPKDFSGDVTYKPLWVFLADYLDDWNKSHPEDKRTANDLFNQIEPPRRLNGQVNDMSEVARKGVEARFGEGYVSERKNRTDYSKGLPAVTRVKLRNDRPLNLSVIYEICKKLGCTIDFVMSYK